MSNQEAIPEAAPVSRIGYVAQIASAYVSHNQVPAKDLPDLIRTINNALSDDTPPAPTAGARQPNDPAVSIKKSVGDDFIVCLEDGKKLTMLKRYLRTQFNMSPEQYRAKWGLPHGYPMVAPAFARLRSAFAKKIGLGKVPVPRKGRVKP